MALRLAEKGVRCVPSSAVRTGCPSAWQSVQTWSALLAHESTVELSHSSSHGAKHLRTGSRVTLESRPAS
eukprot:3858898-Prymnesium_polylepis.1